MMRLEETKWFNRAVDRAYKTLDLDHEGKLDYKEVVIGLLALYDQINNSLPDHVPAPSRQAMLALCKKYDRNANGVIELSEFRDIAKVLMGLGGKREIVSNSLPFRISLVLLAKLLIFPAAAAAIISWLSRSGSMQWVGKLPLAEASLASALYIAAKALITHN